MPEFWRRWHASLGAWFTDYVYYPVSMCKLVKSVKKKSKNKRFAELFAACYPVLIVWLITGIWHGASWKYVAWGLFHASLIISGTIFENFNSKLNKILNINTEAFSWKLWQMTRTFILCCIGRVFFRAGGLAAAIKIFGRMFRSIGIEYVLNDALYAHGLDMYNFNFAIISIGVLWIVDMMQERMSVRGKINEQGTIFRWGITLIAIFTIIVFGIYGPSYSASNFIYEQF
jgi:D-alanyl-lipoteichoic acid acyltransferase DltB (MBOAT superfamily)